MNSQRWQSVSIRTEVFLQKAALAGINRVAKKFIFQHYFRKEKGLRRKIQ
jgi:hypothetical protein